MSKYFGDVGLRSLTKLVRDFVNEKLSSAGGTKVGQVISSTYDLESEDPSFMLCDGRELSKENYPDLYSKIGVKYGGSKMEISDESIATGNMTYNPYPGIRYVYSYTDENFYVKIFTDNNNSDGSGYKIFYYIDGEEKELSSSLRNSLIPYYPSYFFIINKKLFCVSSGISGKSWRIFAIDFSKSTLSVTEEYVGSYHVTTMMAGGFGSGNSYGITAQYIKDENCLYLAIFQSSSYNGSTPSSLSFFQVDANDENPWISPIGGISLTYYSQPASISFSFIDKCFYFWRSAGTGSFYYYKVYMNNP